jgi:hypothetical protein
VLRVDLHPDTQPGTIAFVIDCDLMRFSGTKSSMGSTLWVPVQIVQRNSAQLLALGGWLRFAGEEDGLAIPLQALGMNDGMLRTPVTDEQIARIERKRAGGPAYFELVLKGIGSFGGAGGAVFSAMFNPPVVVPRDEWIKVLERLGAGLRRLIELPPAPRAKGGLWDKALTQIDAAASRLASGDAGGAMNETRTAMESALGAIGIAVNVPRDQGEPLRRFTTRLSKAIRAQHVDRGADPFSALASAIDCAAEVCAFTSDPLHNGLDSAERINAEFALAIVTSLYTYFARLPH